MECIRHGRRIRWAISQNNPRKNVPLLQWALEMFRYSRMAETYATEKLGFPFQDFTFRHGGNWIQTFRDSRRRGQYIRSKRHSHQHTRQKKKHNCEINTLRTGLLNCLNARSRGLTFRHRASCI